MHKVLGLIPARSGSKRVPGKNIRPLNGHPLIAYTISVARASSVFSRIIVSTDGELIRDVALHYGAEVPFIRPKELATSTSPDIEWLKHALSQIERDYDCFCILRPTSPFRQVETIQRAWSQFLQKPEIDSLRAVELCRQHPGKMWTVENGLLKTLLDQSHLKVAWHAGQYQSLPKVYVQNSALEIAWTEVVWEQNCREGKIIAPFFTQGLEGFSIDYESDWYLAEDLIKRKQASLPVVEQAAFAREEKELL